MWAAVPYLFSPYLPFTCRIFPWVEMYSETQNHMCYSGGKFFINKYIEPVTKDAIK